MPLLKFTLTIIPIIIAINIIIAIISTIIIIDIITINIIPIITIASEDICGGSALSTSAFHDQLVFEEHHALLFDWYYTIHDHFGDDHAGDQDDDDYQDHDHHNPSTTSWSLKSIMPCYLIGIIQSAITLVMIMLVIRMMMIIRTTIITILPRPAGL